MTDKVKYGKAREGGGNYNFRGRIRKKHRLPGESYGGWHSSQQELMAMCKLIL